jgi:N-acetylmuramate 1-kinase
MADRASKRARFLAAAGWGQADRAFLSGDASDRSYDRLTRGKDTAVLMDAPPGQGDDPAAFIRVAAHLQSVELSAPLLLAKDLTNGFLLLEDFGDAVFARVLASRPDQEPALYSAAAEAICALQAHAPLANLPALAPPDWAAAAAFALDWYQFAATGQRVDTGPFIRCLTDMITGATTAPLVMILRDYHAENLIWLPNRNGAARAGLLDFQLAQLGDPVYDLVSLLQDARRDVLPATVDQVAQQFCERRGMSKVAFDHAFAVWGAQRALRIMGIFARLCLVGNKPAYLRLMPRVWAHWQTNLRHPAVNPLAKICAPILPAPTPTALARIAALAGQVVE